MKKKCFKKGGSVVDFNVNAVELTTEELKTKVNGGAALTTEQQMEMARRAAKGDYSLPDFITGKTDDSKETKDEVPVTKTPVSKTGGNTTYTPAKTDTDDVPSVVNDDVDTKKKKDVGGGTKSSSGGYYPTYSSTEYEEIMKKNNEYEEEVNTEQQKIVQELSEALTSTSDPDSRRKSLRKSAEDNYLAKVPYKENNSCDEFVYKVLTDANKSPEFYCLSDTKETVFQHIEELKASCNQFDYTPFGDANVVFMGDGNKSYTKDHEHCGLLFYETDGSVTYYDSSSNNIDTLPVKETYNSYQAFASAYAYDTFYFQKVY